MIKLKFRKTAAIATAFTVAITAASCITAAATTYKTASDIGIGDYVQIGKDAQNNDASILWRVVNKEGSTPLLITDKALYETKMYDKEGSGSGSHLITTAENGTASSLYTRQQKGSNYWPDSNIHDWLNSEVAAGSVVYTNGFTPAYSAEAGFLDGFSNLEKGMIKQVYHKNIITAPDAANATGGNENYPWSSQNVSTQYTANLSTYNSNAYYVNANEKIFLPGVKEVYDMQVTNVGTLGNNYYIAKTAAGVATYSWTRTPMKNGKTGDNSVCQVMTVRSDGVGYGSAYAGGSLFAIRPMMYLNESADVVYTGSGTSSDPYIPEAAVSASAINNGVSTGDENTDDHSTGFLTTVENKGNNNETINGLNYSITSADTTKTYNAITPTTTVAGGGKLYFGLVVWNLNDAAAVAAVTVNN